MIIGNRITGLSTTRIRFALLFVFIISRFALGDSPAERGDVESAFWRMTRLDLDLAVDPAGHRLTGTAAARLLLEADASIGPTMEIGEVSKLVSVKGPDGAECSLDADTRLARVRFHSPCKRGTVVELVLGFSNEGRSFQWAIDDDAAYASWASAWYPSPLRGSEAATGVTRLSVPSTWTTVSGGRLIGAQSDRGRRTDIWEASIPLARSFAAGPYRVARKNAGEHEVGVYLLSERADTAALYIEVLVKALEAQEARFGRYPYSNYSIVEIPAALAEWAGSSEQGFFMARSNTLTPDEVNLPLFAHELCHGWWGNLVMTEDPGSLMVGEAMAQYGAVVAIEAIEGKDAATEFLRFSRKGYNPRQCARGFFELWRGGHDKPLMSLTGVDQDHNLADAKGHWVYHMLRRRLGDELFFSTLRSIARDFAGKRMSLRDLRDTFVRAGSPEDELATFFSEWLDRPGAPVLKMEWEPTRQGNAPAARVTIRQVGVPYHLRLDVVVRSEGGDTRQLVRLKQAMETIVVPTPGIPTAVELDPSHELLIWTPDYGPRP